MKGCPTKAYTKHAEYGAVLQDPETCLIGLGYINANVDLLKQAQFASTVITVKKEEGVTVKLDAIKGAEKGKKSDSGHNGTPNFHIPASLDARFIAPRGHYKNAEHHIDIENPDYFVTWDVVKKKDDTEEGQQEWWEWHPQSQAPRVN
jgi:hypothetical protein